MIMVSLASAVTYDKKWRWFRLRDDLTIDGDKFDVLKRRSGLNISTLGLEVEKGIL